VKLKKIYLKLEAV